MKLMRAAIKPIQPEDFGLAATCDVGSRRDALVGDGLPAECRDVPASLPAVLVDMSALFQYHLRSYNRLGFAGQWLGLAGQRQQDRVMPSSCVLR